jgi:hypothetical protein
MRVRRNAALFDLIARLAAGCILLAVSAVLVLNRRNSADGVVPFVFAGFALVISLLYFAAAWTPAQQLRHPNDYVIVLTTDGIALGWSGESRGMSYSSIADAALRRRSFRAIFGHDLVLTSGDGRELILPLGEVFGEPNELLAAIIQRVRIARGLPADSNGHASAELSE